MEAFPVFMNRSVALFAGGRPFIGTINWHEAKSPKHINTFVNEKNLYPSPIMPPKKRIISESPFGGIIAGKILQNGENIFVPPLIFKHESHCSRP